MNGMESNRKQTNRTIVKQEHTHIQRRKQTDEIKPILERKKNRNAIRVQLVTTK